MDVSINVVYDQKNSEFSASSFILEGALTIVMAFAGYALLPNYPSNTSFLSAEETAMAQWRLERENDGMADEVEESVFDGLKQAFSDPKVVSELDSGRPHNTVNGHLSNHDRVSHYWYLSKLAPLFQ